MRLNKRSWIREQQSLKFVDLNVGDQTMGYGYCAQTA